MTKVFLYFTVGFLVYGSPDIAVSSTKLNDPISEINQERGDAEIERAGNLLLNEAKKKYKNGNYWKSSIDLIIILDFYSDYSKLDEAIYLLGNCLYEMGMYTGVNHIYRYLLTKSPDSPILPKVMLGMQKVHYQQRQYRLSLKFYKTLEAHYATVEGIDESRYFAAQAYYHLKNYGLVPNIVRHIKKSSEFYVFGLYSSGLAYLKKKISERVSKNLSRSQNFRLILQNGSISLTALA